MLSADTEEMSWIVQAVRSFELMRGSGIKMPAQSESTTRLNNRKSLVLNRSVRAGSYLSRNDIGIKRPGYGIPPKYFDQVVGRRLRIDLDAEEILTWEHLD
jgi:N-acetylneuraminate synthase